MRLRFFLFSVLSILPELFLVSCSQGMFELLDRTTADPFAEKPAAESFKESNTVLLSWSPDEGADEFILERAEDAERPVYREIYRGGAAGYRDADLPDQGIYLYRLLKRRGRRIFPSSEPVLGVSSLVTGDLQEPNNGEDAATFLDDTTIIANMYFYRSYQGLMVWDEDWYCMDIPPGWRASVVVNDSKAPSGLESHFKIYIKDREINKITHDDPIPVPNYGTEELRCFFKIFPDEQIYVSKEMPSTGVGGGIIQYTIKITGKTVM
jgi:hypothetical protein